MINVYHGSYIKITHPDLSFSREAVDFGKGFYVTPLFKQAVSWALRWQRRGRHSIVNTYSYHEELIVKYNLKFKKFPEYNEEWLHFVAENRNGRQQNEYDIVQGGIANDKVFNTLELYFNKSIPEDEALARHKYEKPNTQICICKQELVDLLLSFLSAEEVKDGSR